MLEITDGILAEFQKFQIQQSMKGGFSEVVMVVQYQWWGPTHGGGALIFVQIVETDRILGRLPET